MDTAQHGQNRKQASPVIHLVIVPVIPPASVRYLGRGVGGPGASFVSEWCCYAQVAFCAHFAHDYRPDRSGTDPVGVFPGVVAGAIVHRRLPI